MLVRMRVVLTEQDDKVIRTEFLGPYFAVSESEITTELCTEALKLIAAATADAEKGKVAFSGLSTAYYEKVLASAADQELVR